MFVKVEGKFAFEFLLWIFEILLNFSCVFLEFSLFLAFAVFSELLIFFWYFSSFFPIFSEFSRFFKFLFIQYFFEFSNILELFWFFSIFKYFSSDFLRVFNGFLFILKFSVITNNLFLPSPSPPISPWNLQLLNWKQMFYKCFTCSLQHLQ